MYAMVHCHVVGRPHVSIGYIYIYGWIIGSWLIGDRTGPYGKAEDRRLGRAGRVMWKDGTSRVIALVYLG
jgi:hypothetical protein